eukprot:COSAG01_NODE_2264_length_8047_cov_18.774409_6_plen_41_part_00
MQLAELHRISQCTVHAWAASGSAWAAYMMLAACSAILELL